MKNLILIAITTLSTLAYAKSNRVINVFYDSKNGELTANTESSTHHTGFIRTNKIVVISEDISFCKDGCLATIRANRGVSFSIIVAGRKIATVKTNDPDSMLLNTAFSTNNEFGKELLVLNLEALKNDSRSEVTR